MRRSKRISPCKIISVNRLSRRIKEDDKIRLVSHALTWSNLPVKYYLSRSHFCMLGSRCFLIARKSVYVILTLDIDHQYCKRAPRCPRYDNVCFMNTNLKEIAVVQTYHRCAAIINRITFCLLHYSLYTGCVTKFGQIQFKFSTILCLY